MPRRRRSAIWFLAVVGVALGAILFRWFSRAPLPPLEVSLWYWHQPFRIPPAEVAQLRAIGVRQLFVHAGTFEQTKDGVRLVLPQSWETYVGGLGVHLVFNFDYAFVRNFGDLSNDALAAAVRDAVQQERNRARFAGVNVIGIQFDFDCPTRRLTKYADLLTRLQSLRAMPRDTISITALPTWYTSDDVQTVLNAVDFAVPQYYEAEIPKTLDKFATISHLRNVERGLEAAGRRGQPFYVGLPAYGHALMYDDRGALLGLYRDMSARDALRHPSFRLARAFPADKSGKLATPATYIGEDLYDFIAVRPARDGRGKGYHLLYDVPTPALVAQHLALIQSQRPANCRGVILFRYPEPNQTASLPLTSLAAALHGEKAQPNLRIQVKATNAPWELIETGHAADHPPVDLTVTVTNIGTGSTFLAPDAVTVTLSFDRPSLEEADAHHFDSLESFYETEGVKGRRGERVKGEMPNDSTPDSLSPPHPLTSSPFHPFTPSLRASLRRANVLRFRKSYLAAGESAKIGPIHVPANGATKVWGEWSATGAGGFEIQRGTIPPTQLSPQETKR